MVLTTVKLLQEEVQSKTEVVTKLKDENKSLVQILKIEKKLSSKKSNRKRFFNMNQAVMEQRIAPVYVTFLTYMYNSMPRFCQYLMTKSTWTDFCDVLNRD